VRRLPWGVGRRRIAEILKGSQARGITELYRQQTYYGRFHEFSRKEIETWIEHLIQQGYLNIVGGDIPVVALSLRGRQALQARASIALELPEDPPSCSPSPATRPSSRPRSADETLHLAREGKNPAEIAAARGLTEGTVFKHLATLIGAGRLELSAVVSEEVAAQVQAVIAQVGDLSRLAPLKERLPDEISYGELRCVVVAAKRQRQEMPAVTSEE
jgi:uncharacterized protein YpbB